VGKPISYENRVSSHPLPHFRMLPPLFFRWSAETNLRVARDTGTTYLLISQIKIEPANPQVVHLLNHDLAHFCGPSIYESKDLRIRRLVQRRTSREVGSLDASHPPPMAWIKATLAIFRRANISTAAS
jgi:hypothetical protein